MPAPLFYAEGMLSDTSPEAARFYYQRLAALTPSERIQIGLELTAAADNLLRAAIARRFPHASEEELQYQLLRARYGKELADRVWRR